MFFFFVLYCFLLKIHSTIENKQAALVSCLYIGPHLFFITCYVNGFDSNRHDETSSIRLDFTYCYAFVIT